MSGETQAKRETDAAAKRETNAAAKRETDAALWPRRLTFGAIGIGQGVALFLLAQFGRSWIEEAAFRESLALFVMMAPPLFYLSHTGKKWIEAAAFGAGLPAILALMHLWTVLASAGGPANRLIVAMAAAFVCGFILLPFFQIWREERRWRFPYPRLFELSWNNGLEFVAALFFVAALWLLLLLWAALFKIVDISFFGRLFSASWFVWPASCLGFGLGVAIFREQERVLSSMRALAFALISSLAPVLPTAAILFLFLLPFAGLDTLWRTGYASSILVAVIVTGIGLANIMVRDGESDPAPSPVSLWPISILLLLSPLFTGFAFYAAIARIMQHGVSPERFYALLIIFIVGIYSVVYGYAILRHRAGWGRAICHYNPALAALTALTAVLVMSPLADSHRISAYAQYYRLTGGYVSAATFDYGYLKYRLGQPGHNALRRIRADSGAADRKEVQARLAALDTTRTYPEWMKAQREFLEIKTAREYGLLVDYILVLPEGRQLPDGLARHLVQDRPGLLKWCHARPYDRCAIVVADLSGDPAPEIVIARHWTRRHVEFEAYRGSGRQWRSYDRWSAPEERADAVWTALKRNDLSIVPPAHKVLRIGEDTVPIAPRR